MHQRYRTQGIFLKKTDRGEADQLFVVFTEQFGKVEVLARAIRKITSKLRSGADVFYFSEIEFIQGKHHKILTDAAAIDKFDNIRQNLQKLEIVQKAVGVLDFFITKEEKDEKLWQLTLEIFEKLNYSGYVRSREARQPPAPKGQDTNYQLIYHYFLWNLLTILGYSPELNYCPVCRKKLLPETFFFVPDEGGVVCWRCFSKKGLKNNGPWFNIQVDTVKVLRVFIRNNWDFAGKLTVGADIRQNFLEISENYCSFLQESNS